MANNEVVQKYFDSLAATYDILVDAATRASERATKVSTALAADFIKGQREAIELGRKLASEPTDMAGFYSALLESATEAQGRSLAFTQDAYQEALAAGTDARETVEKVVASNRETAKLAIEAARELAGANPFAEALQKGFEAFAPQAAEAPKATKKEKVAV